ncbi:MAG: acylneuraminate cytidylyltransferase family protein [Candidatus Omnitrophica bacterium]|nr:acylneuraminate cytidylyltransferase family protein [Candidatus Omnitrophota bacterium]
MYKKHKILALIPARGGSKRLKNKNILPLAGKPLIAHTIDFALASKYIDRVIVSTDSLSIARVAKRYKAEVPFLRPAKIAEDRTSDYPVVAHAIRWLKENEDYSVDIVVFLRPTVPLRAKGLAERCIERLVNNAADSVRTVRSVGRYHPYWMLTVDKNGKAHPFIKGKSVDRYYQKQLLPALYEHDGYCDAILSKNIDINCSPDAGLTGFYGQRMSIVMNDSPEPLVNIDTYEDFILAEYLMKRGLCHNTRK